jgi:hypothetical protein
MSFPERPSPRHTLRAPLRVERIPAPEAPAHLLGFASNVSETGLFIECALVPPVGTHLALKLELPGEPEPIVLRRTRIVWKRGQRADSRPVGAGVTISDLDPSARLAWRRFCIGQGEDH